MLDLKNTLGRVVTSTVAVAAVAFMLGGTFAAPVAHGQTSTEQQIAELQAMIAKLQAQLSGTTTTTTSGMKCPVDPNLIVAAGLKVGYTGNDAKQVQVLMNFFAKNKGTNSMVSMTGAGSPGMESMYYGPATAAAVKRFQEFYRAEILTPNGLTMGTGYYGPSTSAQVQVLCKSMTTTTPDPVDPTDEDDEDEDDSDSDELSGGEATIDNFQFRSADDAEEGTPSTVASVEFGAEDGDLMVERLDLMFSRAAGTGDTSPWNVFDSVSLEVDGDEIASMDTDSRSDWSKQSGNTYRLRFTGLEEIVRENEDVQIDVVVTPASVVRTAGTAGQVQWDVQVPNFGLRTIDGEGLNDYAPNGASSVVRFDVNKEASNSDFKARKSSDNPKSSTLEVKTTGRSDEYTVLGFELESEDVMSIINGANFNLQFSNGKTYTDVIDRATLVLDGRSYNVDTTLGATSTASTTISFDVDGDVELEDGDTVDGELMLSFRSTGVSTYPNGTTVKAALKGIDAETENGTTVPDASDVTVTGETHTLVSEGLSTMKPSRATGEGKDVNDNAYAVFTVVFDVKALGDDFFVPDSTQRLATTSTSSTSGIDYRILDSNGATATGTIISATLDSTGDEETNSFRVAEDESETFTLTVSYDPSANGGYRLQLVNVNFAPTDSTTATQSYSVSPESEYRTTTATVIE